MVIRVITCGSMAGVFMWSVSVRGQGDIDKKLSELKNSPQGGRLKHLLSVALELIASVFLCKKAMNSIDRMDI